MATTTNYGWTTPDDTALVKDGAAAIRTLGSSVDTTTKNLNPETTLGDIAYRSSTANVNTRLALGTANQQLRVNAGATAPEWFTPAAGGGGKVLQVIQGTTTTSTTIASTSATDTTITATITPTLATSKILVLASSSVRVLKNNDGNNNATQQARVALLRGASVIVDANTTAVLRGNSENANDRIDFAGYYTTTFLDTPATTSATTYKIQASAETTSNSGSVTFQYSGSLGQITLLEIGA